MSENIKFAPIKVKWNWMLESVYERNFFNNNLEDRIKMKHLKLSMISIFIIFSISSNLYAEEFHANYFPNSDKFNIVHVQPSYWGTYYELICEQPGGTKTCDWYTGLQNCIGCDNKVNIFNDANGQEMYDYAVEQIEQGIQSGSYTNNIIQSPLGTFYRTVEWNFIPQNNNYEIVVYLTNME